LVNVAVDVGIETVVAVVAFAHVYLF